MAKKNYDFTEIERNYINDVNTYRDSSNNVYFAELESSGCAVYARPIQGSKGSYVFKEKNENNAYFLARELMDKSQGYSFEVRNKRVLCKPTTGKATLVMEVDDRLTAYAIVKYLRQQEVLNLRKYNATKGFSFIKKAIINNLTEDELYESLFDTMDEIFEEQGRVKVNDVSFFHLKTAKKCVLNRDFGKDAKKYVDRLNQFGLND